MYEFLESNYHYVFSLFKTWDNKQGGLNTQVEGGHKNKVENGAGGTESYLSVLPSQTYPWYFVTVDGCHIHRQCGEAPPFLGSSIMVAWHSKCAISYWGDTTGHTFVFPGPRNFSFLNSQGGQSGMILIVVGRLHLGCEFPHFHFATLFLELQLLEKEILYLVSLISCDGNVSRL